MRIFRNFHIIIFFCLITTASSTAQRISIHHPQLRFLFEDSLLQNPAYHSALQPFEISVSQLKSAFHSESACQKTFFISPVIDAAGGYSFKTKEYSYQLGQGTYMAGNLGKKAGFELSAVLYEQTFPGESYSIDSLKLVPRNNRPLWGKGEEAIYGNIRGNIWWQPNRWLTFKAGNDKFFIGDGQQSLLLSENAAAYPFFQTKLKIWKIQYQHQVMFMRDLIYGYGSKRFTKYSSTHVLSYNMTPRINLFIFETVIWRKQDSVRYRGFDLTYLNPFLFYRPVEFNQGSPDNELMGVGGKWRMFGKNYLYGQLLLDEFRLQELKANKGWWANKYGYQLGFKSYGLFRRLPSFVSVEYNQVRPFTFSHTYSLQNYGYLMQPLAHPLGSNFRQIEGVFRIQLSQKWLIHATGVFSRFGTDPVGLNYGSDMYKKQWTFSKKEGNYTTQGILHTVVNANLTISRLLVPEWRLTAFSCVNLLMEKTGTGKEFHPAVQVGINTLLYE